MKIPGISKKGNLRLPEPFRGGKPVPFQGRMVHDQDRLDELWDSGKILDFVPSAPFSPPPPTQEQREEFARVAAERRGMTEREKRTEAFGREAAQDLASDRFKWANGLTQQTSRGPAILSSNVLELRRKFGHA